VSVGLSLCLDLDMAALTEIGQTTVTLSDGVHVTLRPITPDDEPLLEDFLAHLSLRSFAMRFFGAGVSVHHAAHDAAATGGTDRFGLLAECDGRVVGHAMYVRSKPNAVDAAFAVADDMQCHGLGTQLVAATAEAARSNGFELLEADVLPENHRMLDVFAESGYPLHLRAEPGSVHVTATLSGDEKWNAHSSLDTTVPRPLGELSITRLPG
jgi:acetate---CoA ligase (ADP-forming)